MFAVTAVTLLAGCEPVSDKPPRKAKIAVVISTFNNPWFVVLGETAKARAQELGYDANLFDSQNDPATEAAHFENIVAGGYSAILLNATDSDGSIASVRKAKASGIPVFCIDREINANDAATSQILSDNYSGCIALGEYFADQLDEAGAYVEILGQVGDNNTWNRSKGFHSVVDRFPKLKMVAQQMPTSTAARHMMSWSRCCRLIPTSTPCSAATTRWRWALTRHWSPRARADG